MWPELEHLEASNFYMPQVIDRAIKQCALTCFALIYWNCIVSCLFLLVNTCLPQEWTCYFQLKNTLQLTIMLFFKGCRIVFGFFFASGFVFFFGFLSRYHLPRICNRLEQEPVILHGVCYIWPCLLSILHGMCDILAFQPLICMVFATFWSFNRSCGSLEGSLGFQVGFHLRLPLRVSGFMWGFI